MNPLALTLVSATQDRRVSRYGMLSGEISNDRFLVLASKR